MDIGVVGTGNVGRALGSRWARAGERVVFGTREPTGEEVDRLRRGAEGDVRVGTCSDAINDSEIVLLAIPWEAVRHVLNEAGRLDGKILIDCINPLTQDLKGLELGQTTSAAEQIAGWFPTARVVKAFNTLSAAAMQDPHFGGQTADMFYCGDDPEAKAAVAALGETLKYRAVDCGPLRIARYLEATAMLYVHLAIFEGWGGDCALKILKR